MNPGTPEVQTTPDIRSESWHESGGKQKQSHPKKEGRNTANLQNCSKTGSQKSHRRQQSKRTTFYFRAKASLDTDIYRGNESPRTSRNTPHIKREPFTLQQPTQQPLWVDFDVLVVPGVFIFVPYLPVPGYCTGGKGVPDTIQHPQRTCLEGA